MTAFKAVLFTITYTTIQLAIQITKLYNTLSQKNRNNKQWTMLQTKTDQSIIKPDNYCNGNNQHINKDTDNNEGNNESSMKNTKKRKEQCLHRMVMVADNIECMDTLAGLDVMADGDHADINTMRLL